MKIRGFLLCACLWIAPATAGIIDDVRESIAKNDLAGAERKAQTFQKAKGATPELAAAVSYIARGFLNAKNLDRADTLATRARDLGLQNLHGRKLDQVAFLPIAVGASIEVHAQVLNARGQKADAIAFLREQLKTYGTT